MAETATWDAVLAAAVEIKRLHRPDDILRLYACRETLAHVRRVADGRGDIAACFTGLPFYYDDTLPVGVVEGDRRDGTRVQLIPEPTP